MPGINLDSEKNIAEAPLMGFLVELPLEKLAPLKIVYVVIVIVVITGTSF